MDQKPKKKPNDAVCPDCGARVSGGKVGCGKLFEQLLARDFSDSRFGRFHRLAVDVYSLQHPEQYMRSGKPFAAHLTGMYAALEGDDAAAINHSVQEWLNGESPVEKPANIPRDRGALTIAHMQSAKDAETHNALLQEWARSAWEAWSEYHALAREWVEEAGAD